IERAMLFCAAPGDSLTGALDRRARRQGFVPVLEGERLAGVVLPEAVLRQAEQGQVGSKQAAA
ncbi:MAG: hypothetical protein NTZ05_18970, partial [Chloroflexi bacterium]|nr:hypothetical protein [Chloroflexota bacterium]